jgi:hypothetical protein
MIFQQKVESEHQESVGVKSLSLRAFWQAKKKAKRVASRACWNVPGEGSDTRECCKF